MKKGRHHRVYIARSTTLIAKRYATLENIARSSKIFDEIDDHTIDLVQTTTR
jgi:hypothetical protein